MLPVEEPELAVRRKAVCLLLLFIVETGRQGIWWHRVPKAAHERTSLPQQQAGMLSVAGVHDKCPIYLDDPTAAIPPVCTLGCLGPNQPPQPQREEWGSQLA